MAGAQSWVCRLRFAEVGPHAGSAHPAPGRPQRAAWVAARPLGATVGCHSGVGHGGDVLLFFVSHGAEIKGPW